MSTLLTEMQKTEMTFTDNGALTHSTTANTFVDLFFAIGSCRNNIGPVQTMFSKAVAIDMGLSIRMLLWARDVRGGAGERAIVHDLVPRHVINRLTDAQADRFIRKLPEVGRWDDVWKIFYGTKFQTIAFDVIAEALNKKEGLCAKWMPREKSSNKRVAMSLRKHMKISNTEYRKMLSALTTVVETDMCAQKWDDIELGHVPSQAMNIYSKAFARQSPDRWETYMDDVESGKAKINAGAIYPYQLIDRNGQSYHYQMSPQQEAQWKALPNYAGEREGSIIPVVDVSASMGRMAGKDTSVTCMQVALSLGLYLSERLQGPFQDSFITFSDRPTVQTLKGSLNDKLKQLSSAEWAMTTNLDAVFETILNSAVKAKLPESDMPGTVLILSDMQFNSCVRGGTQMDGIEKMYADAGYKVPQVVFWNLNYCGNVPVTYDKTNTALVSGFSPSIIKSVIGADDLTPVSVMMKTLLDIRYNW